MFKIFIFLEETINYQQYFVIFARKKTSVIATNC